MADDVAAELTAKLAAGTPGPWHIGYERCDCGGGYPCGHEDYPYELVGPLRTDPSPNFPEYDDHVGEIAQLKDADAALIVAAVNAAGPLLAEVERLRAQVAAVEALGRTWEHRAHDEEPSRAVAMWDCAADLRAALDGGPR